MNVSNWSNMPVISPVIVSPRIKIQVFTLGPVKVITKTLRRMMAN